MYGKVGECTTDEIERGIRNYAVCVIPNDECEGSRLHIIVMMTQTPVYFTLKLNLYKPLSVVLFRHYTH